MPKATEKTLVQKRGDAKIDLAAGDEIGAFEIGDIGGQADGERGQHDVPADHPDELQPREQQRVERHSGRVSLTDGPAP